MSFLFTVFVECVINPYTGFFNEGWNMDTLRLWGVHRLCLDPSPTPTQGFTRSTFRFPADTTTIDYTRVGSWGTSALGLREDYPTKCTGHSHLDYLINHEIPGQCNLEAGAYTYTQTTMFAPLSSPPYLVPPQTATFY